MVVEGQTTTTYSRSFDYAPADADSTAYATRNLWWYDIGCGCYRFSENGVKYSLKSYIAAFSGGSGISGLTTNGVAVATSSTTIGTYAGLTWDNTNKSINIIDGSNTLKIFGSNQNTFVGHNTGNFTLTGNFNQFFGNSVGLDVTTGSRNTKMGYAAGDVNQTGDDLALFGFTAGNHIVNSSRSSIFGSQSTNTVSGNDLTLIGYSSGKNSGHNCISIGSQADVGVNGNNDQLSIQNIIYGQGNNGTGSTASTGRIGIGVKNPLTKLHVDGEIRLGTTSTAGNQTISVASSSTNANLILTPQGTGTVQSRFTGVPTSTLAGLDMGSFAGIPSGIANGQLVYNTTTNEAIVRINGVDVAINKASQLTGTIPTTSGGTGMSSLGTPGQSIVVNATATGLEYQTVAGGSSWATTGNTNITTPTITGVPTFIGHNVIQTNGLGNTQTNTSGLVLDNTTDALVGAQQQFSPALRFRGRGWVTGGSVSNTLDFRLDNYTNPGTSGVSGFFRIATSVNGAAYADQYLFGNDGTMYVGAVNGAVNITGAGSSLTCQNWYSGNNNLKMAMRLPTGTISGTTSWEWTGASANLNNTTHTALKYTGASYNFATGSGTYIVFAQNHTINTTGSYSGGTHIGFDHDPTLTSTTGLSHIAYRAVSGSGLFGGTTLTSGTRMDIRGISSGNILRLADNSNTPVMVVANSGISNDDTKTRVLAIDATTGQLYYRTASTIGTSYTASNGIEISSNNIQLGSAFTKNTSMDGNGWHVTLGASGNRLGNFRVWSGGTISLDATTAATWQVGGSSMTLSTTTATLATSDGGLSVGTSGHIFTDSRGTPTGLEYNADYFANYTNRSLTDWLSVKSHFGGKAVDALVMAPTITEDGYVVSWNNTNNEYELVAQTGGGGVTSVDVSGGTTGLTTSGGPVTTSGTITLAGTLGVANGGTGATTLTSGRLLVGNGTSAISASSVSITGAIATNLTAINGQLKVGIGSGSDTTPAQQLDVQDNSSNTNAVLYPFRIRTTSSGSPANGIGTGIEFVTETTAGIEIGSTIESVATDVTSSSEDFDMVFKTMSAGATATEKLRVTSTGIGGDSGGLKHGRITTGSITALTTTNVTYTWTTAFADTNYTVNASVLEANGELEVVGIISTSTTTVVVAVKNTNVSTARTGTLHVMAMHD